jgi:hypothetical protein
MEGAEIQGARGPIKGAGIQGARGNSWKELENRGDRWTSWRSWNIWSHVKWLHWRNWNRGGRVTSQEPSNLMEGTRTKDADNQEYKAVYQVTSWKGLEQTRRINFRTEPWNSRQEDDTNISENQDKIISWKT